MLVPFKQAKGTVQDKCSGPMEAISQAFGSTTCAIQVG